MVLTMLPIPFKKGDVVWLKARRRRMQVDETGFHALTGKPCSMDLDPDVMAMPDKSIRTADGRRARYGREV